MYQPVPRTLPGSRTSKKILCHGSMFQLIVSSLVSISHHLWEDFGLALVFRVYCLTQNESEQNNVTVWKCHLRNSLLMNVVHHLFYIFVRFILNERMYCIRCCLCEIIGVILIQIDSLHGYRRLNFDMTDATVSLIPQLLHVRYSSPPPTHTREREEELLAERLNRKIPVL